MVLSVLVTIVGLLLIFFTVFDIFITVLHPQAESPFSSRLQTGVWVSMRIIARGLPGRTRHRFLGLAVPLMIVVLMATWVIVLLIAFGLVYSAWINSPGAFFIQNGHTNVDWTDAMYFSGETLGTIGYGDFQPAHMLLRIAAIAEGFSGIAVLSMSIAYVLELYPVLQRASVLAVLLNEETGGQVSGLPMLARYLRNNNFEALAGLLRTVNLELLFLAEAHRRLPVLHYSHPTEVERSFLRVLLVVRNLVAALRFGLAGDGIHSISDDPRVQDLEDSLFYTLYTLGSSLHLPLSTEGDKEVRTGQIYEEFQAMLNQMSAFKLKSLTPQVTPGEGAEQAQEAAVLQQARARYLRFFLASDTPILSYLRNTGYKYPDAIRTADRPMKLVLDLDAEARDTIS